jgi:hypothetical protein
MNANSKKYEEQLTGGHPNSLGNTIEVVSDVLTDRAKLKDLIECWQSEDELVRLRVQNGVKRVAKEKPEWVAEFIPDLLGWITKIDQASTKWCLSTLYMWLENYMSHDQQIKAIEVMKSNLHYDDWIVQNTTAESLTHFAMKSEDLKEWLLPELQKLTGSRHKSVARRAQKYIESLLSNNKT